MIRPIRGSIVMVASTKTTAITVVAVLAIVIALVAIFPPEIESIYIDDDHSGDSYMLWSLAAPVIAIYSSVLRNSCRSDHLFPAGHRSRIHGPFHR